MTQYYMQWIPQQDWGSLCKPTWPVLCHTDWVVEQNTRNAAATLGELALETDSPFSQPNFPSPI